MEENSLVIRTESGVAGGEPLANLDGGLLGGEAEGVPGFESSLGGRTYARRGTRLRGRVGPHFSCAESLQLAGKLPVAVVMLERGRGRKNAAYLGML